MLLTAAVLLVVAIPLAAAEDAVVLFNGKDLTGWTHFLEKKGPNADGSMGMEDVWSVDAERGVLVCKGVPNGYIKTTDDYTSFVLTFEWRWPGEPSNSGVLLRQVGPDEIWPRCIEAQLKNGQAGDFWAMGGAKLDVARPDPERPNHGLKARAAEKPAGEWNRYHITVDGDRVVLKVNGELVNEGTGAEVVPGRIGLQSEGTPIEFRNIRLIPIPK
jgi:hypothetical protein